MSSKIATLFILVSFCALSFSQAPTKQEISKAGIKTRITYYYIEDDVERDPLYTYTESYDRSGNLIMFTEYSNRDKATITQSHFFYNELDQLYKKTQTRYLLNTKYLNAQQEVFIYEYNEKGLRKKSDHDTPIEYVFDSLGRVAQMIMPYPEAYPFEIKRTYVYSNSDLLIQETVFETKYNRISSETFYKYDSDAKLSRTRYRYFFYDSETKTQVSEHKTKYFYDSNGLLVKTIQRQTRCAKVDTKASNRISIIEYQYY